MSAESLEAYDVVLQPDGKILVAGVAGNDFLLVRYLPNGELDPAFEGDGVTLVQFSAGRDQAYALALQADGKIMAAGHSFVAGENRNRFAVARLLPDGLPDLTFAGSGRVIVPVAGESDSVRALALQNDGKIVLAGLCFRNVAPGNDFTAVRLHPDGTVDTSFAQAGKALFDLNTDSNDEVDDVALDATGRLILAGTSGDLLAVARLQADPPLLPTPTPLPSPSPTSTATPTAAPTATPQPNRLANISTRLRVETGDNVLIGGFIVTGSMQKRIIVRALGPSLPLEDRLANPLAGALRRHRRSDRVERQLAGSAERAGDHRQHDPAA